MNFKPIAEADYKHKGWSDFAELHYWVRKIGWSEET